MKLEPAKASDFTALTDQLREVNLPYEDLPPSLDNFLLIKAEDKVIASVGLEIYGAYALLRSLATSYGLGDKGLANNLFDEAILLAKRNEVKEAFLITSSANKYFERRGFKQVEREKAPDEIKNTSQFKGVCPASATIMTLKIY